MPTHLFDLSGQHPTYASVKKVLQRVSQSLGLEYHAVARLYANSRIVPLGSSKYLFYANFPIGGSELYVLLSPLICLNCWSALLSRAPMVIVEEYSPKKSIVDVFAKFFLYFFSRNPFIAQTVRSNNFMRRLNPSVFFVPPAETKHKGSGKRKHVLFISKLLSSKNPRLFLVLAKAFPEESFIMIGKGEMLSQIKEEAKSLKNLQIIPHVESRDKLFEYYANAKLLIHPAWKDPIGHVIIEALSTQTPVLASSGAGASDFLPKEWVLDPKDEKAWMEKVNYILSHQKESIKKAEEAFEKRHLDIDDPYFEKVADELAAYIRKRWPKLAKKP